MSVQASRADARLVELLARIDGCTSDMTQQRADTMLARVAWSRIAEPGDGVAGILIFAVGVERALELLVQSVDARAMQQALRESHLPAAGEVSTRALTEALSRWTPRLNRSETVLDIERAYEAHIRIVLPGDPLWPPTLDDLGVHAPNMLWVRGEAHHLRADSLGVVGARAATGYGSHVTAELVDGVCGAGVSIVSGAAYGIDAVAHRTALAAGAPTIAVVAGGADRPYPRAHESLLERISAEGVVCSEMVPGSAPTRWRFLQRNRLIAALSQATLVTEAGVRSGSLNTAGHASQLGRPIAAVPGPITSAASAGCHKLVRDYDAVLVTNAQEVCELMGIDSSSALFAGDEDEDRDHAWVRRVCDALPLRGFRDLASIARLAGLGVEQTRGMLAELELLGKVRRNDSATGGEPQWGLSQ